MFTCTGQGSFVLWKINGAEIINVMVFEGQNNDIDIYQHSGNENGSSILTIAINISLARNETQISCVVQHGEPNSTEESQAIFLIVAGILWPTGIA